MPFCEQVELFSDLSGDEIVRQWKIREENKKKEYEKLVSDTTKSVIKELKDSKKKKKKKKLNKKIKKAVKKELEKGAVK